MSAAGQRLRRVQVEAHAALDRIYAPIAAAVRALALRFAAADDRGILRLPPAARPAIRSEVERLVAAAELEAARVVVSSVTAAQLAAADGDQDRSLVDDAAALALIGLIALGSLRRNRASVVRQADLVVARGIAASAPAREVGHQLGDYFSPFFAPRRAETGGLRRAERRGAIESWPGRSGMASQHARALMLFQATAGHARTTRRLAERDGFGLRWNLSAGHAEADECDTHAHRGDLGRGVYSPRNFPRMPSHPQCRCFTTTVDLSRL